MACPTCNGTMYAPENLEAFLNGVAGNVECMCGTVYHHQAAGLVIRQDADSEIETTADLIAKHNREVEYSQTVPCYSGAEHDEAMLSAEEWIPD